MPDIFNNMILGFSVILSPENLFFCFLGVLSGTLVGVLPGIGPIAGMSLLLPVTFHITPIQAIIMLAGMFYGTQYGGSTTSILVNIPGEAASVVTCIDGYKMALKGRAGSALGISAFGSFVGGTLSILALMLIAPPLAKAALAFGPPEFFSLLLLCLPLMTYLGGGKKVKMWIMAIFGLLLGTIGLDTFTGDERFAFGSMTLVDGLGLAPVAMGLFGVSEILMNIFGIESRKEVIKTRLKELLPSAEEWRLSLMPMARGSLLGFLIGILPGAGPIISAFTSYALEKRLSRHPEQFGNGAIEGVAGPETANNAATGGSFIPLLTLGVPSNTVTAILLAAFLVHGLLPGPRLIQANPALFWGIIMSMYVGNVMLLILNLPLISIWVQVLRVPYIILFPIILMFMIIGCYSVNSNILDVLIMGCFGILGYVLRKFDFNCAPLVFGLILSPLLEGAFRQSLMMSKGSFLIFVARPISLTLLILFVLIILLPVLKMPGWFNWFRDAEN